MAHWAQPYRSSSGLCKGCQRFHCSAREESRRISAGRTDRRRVRQWGRGWNPGRSQSLCRFGRSRHQRDHLPDGPDTRWSHRCSCGAEGVHRVPVGDAAAGTAALCSQDRHALQRRHHPMRRREFCPPSGDPVSGGSGDDRHQRRPTAASRCPARAARLPVALGRTGDTESR